MAKVSGLEERTFMANHKIFPSLGSLLSSLHQQNNLQKFWSNFYENKSYCMGIGVGNGKERVGQLWFWTKTEGSQQIRYIKDNWQKIRKRWEIKCPVITPEWCLPFSSLLLPWVLLSYHCNLTWAKIGSSKSLHEDHQCPTDSGDAQIYMQLG